MKTIVFILMLGGVSLGHLVYAQEDNGHDSEFMYDPTFWKEDLRLSKTQYYAISEINSEFYTNLIQTAHQTAATEELAPTDLLNQRQELIWDLLSSRQKNKWRKISKSFN
jgi:hypothetical protein